MTSMSAVAQAVEELIPEQYAQGWTTAQLGRQWGVSSYRVTVLTQRAGVYDPHRKSGAPLREVCGKGHNQKKHRKHDTKGYPYCGECKRIRQRVKR